MSGTMHPAITMQNVEAARRTLEGLKGREVDLDQKVAALKAKGLEPISFAAYQKGLKNIKGGQENDELLFEFLSMKEGRNVSRLRALSQILLLCIEQNETDCAHGDEALDHFNNVLKERLMGDDPVDLRGIGNLDPSFTPFKTRALAWMEGKVESHHERAGLRLAEYIDSPTKLEQLKTVANKDRAEDSMLNSRRKSDRKALYTSCLELVFDDELDNYESSGKEYDEADPLGEDIQLSPRLEEIRPRMKLGYHKTYKIDVYCFYLGRLHWATEGDITRLPFGNTPRKDRPLLAHCFAHLDLYEPFKSLLDDLNWKGATKKSRSLVSERLREWYESQEELPQDKRRSSKRQPLAKCEGIASMSTDSTYIEPIVLASAFEMDADGANDLIREWEEGNADYDGLRKKETAERVVAAYGTVRKRAPPVDLVCLTAGKISANYYKMNPSLVMEWRKWQDMGKLQPTVEDDIDENIKSSGGLSGGISDVAF